MKNDPTRKTTKKANSRKWKAQWKKIVSTLAAVTVFCTTYALILPAITVNSNTYCGLEEHEHTEACYTKELICGFEEGEAQGESDETAPETVTETVTEIVTETVIEKEIQQVLVDEGHVHQDSCYEETRNLVCGLEETESKEAVLDEEGNVIEEAVEGHTHTDECYQVERVLVCGQEEREPVYEEQEVEVEKEVQKEVQKEVEVPVEQPAQPAQPAGEPHVHTDACYKEVLTCGKEEHKHVDECFSNPTLDLETAADWEKTLPKEDELTENWAEDVLTIAKSQLGYKESSRNFKAVNGDRKGYTRYGARFGAPYSDWCAMFIQFAMHYAGVDERLMPGNPSVSKWIENAKKIENYFEPADYTPVPGDIMFIDWDKVVEGVERDGDHIGIVAEVKTTEETTPDGAKLEVPTSIVTIEGNLDNEVKYNTYKIDDERILGYSHMPEKPATEEELEERVEEIEALIEGKELVEGEEGTEGEEPAEGTEEENEEKEVDTIIALASYTESGVQVNFEAPSSVFPEGTVDPALNVVEILPGTPEYDEFFAQAQANAGTEVLNARFFDISVVDLEGNEIKLNDESLAKVEIVFPENETMTTEGNIDVLHFAEEGLEVLESQVQGGEEVEAITFDTTSFSPYGVVQTGSSGDESGEGSGSGSGSGLLLGSGSGTPPAIPELASKNGSGEYVVTSWYALEQLIENRKYKDIDGTEKTDAPNTMTVILDNDLAASSQIKISSSQTINLKGNGDAGATIYIDNTNKLSGDNEMFWVNGGTFNLENVTLSGRKANFTAGSASANTCVDTPVSKMLEKSVVSYVKSTGSTGNASNYASTLGGYTPSGSSYIEFKKDNKPLRINSSTHAMEYTYFKIGSEVRYSGNKLYYTSGPTTYYIKTDGSVTTDYNSASNWTYSGDKLTSGNTYLALTGDKVSMASVSTSGGSPAALKIGSSDGTISNVVRANNPLEIGAQSWNFEIKVKSKKNNGHGIWVPDAEISSFTSGEYYFIETLNGSTTLYLSANAAGGASWTTSLIANEDGGYGERRNDMWKYTSGGTLQNVKTGQVLFYDGSNIYVKKLTDTVTGPFGCDSTATPDTCTPIEGDYTDDDVVSADTKGFFIAADNGAKVNLKSGTVLEGLKYTGASSDVSPIYVKGANTELNINGAEIKNNRGTLPALQNNNRKLLYNDVLDWAKNEKNDPTWDINPGGTDYRLGHDSNKISAGAIRIEGATVNFRSGTLGGENAGNTGIAGAVYIDGGTFNQYGGTIDENHALKGAVVVKGASSHYNLETGTLSNNDSSIYGGAISAFDEGKVTVGKDSTQTCDETDVPVISNNKTLHQGGGIYVHSDNVDLNRARISNNIAHFMGGGIYVYGGDEKQNERNSVLILDDTYITDNKAGNTYFTAADGQYGFRDSWGDGNYGEGGGMWLCTYGSFIMDGNEIHIWGNESDDTAPDFYKHARNGASGIITEFRVDELDRYKKTGDGSSFPSASFTPVTGRLSLRNDADDSSYTNEMNSMCDSVRITGNRAGYAGGGIGSNGILSYRPLTNENVYQPEFSFTKNLKNKDGSNVDKTGKSVMFNVKVYNLALDPSATEPVATYENIELKNGQNITDDPTGVNTTGVKIQNWTAYITLPQLYDASGNSLYKGLIENQSRTITDDDATASYNIDNKIKIVIEEVSMNGDVLSLYDLKLGDLGYNYTTNVIQNNQQDLKITYHTVKLTTQLTNERREGKGRVELTKKDKDRDTVIDNPDNQPEFRISAVNDSDELIDTVGTVIEGTAGIYTTDYLTPGKYAIWESKAPNGYDGLGADKFIYVNIAADGTPSFVSTTGQANHVVAGSVIAGTSTDTSINDGGTLPITVYNDKHTKLTIAKVDKDGNPINSASTKFRIMTFDGTTFSKEFTLDATGETNYYEIANEDVETFFSATNLNLDNANFFLKETVPPSNRYNALDTVIPFRVRKVNGNNYQFIPMTLKQVNDLGTTRVTKGSDGKTFTIVATQDKIKFASTANDETRIEGVTITSGEGSLTYQVQNEMKPIKVKVAKLDENGDPLPGATFTLRKAGDKTGNDYIRQTSNTPDNGIYTFENSGTSTFLKPGEAYSLWETNNPDGYAPLGIGVIIEIDEHGVAHLVSDETKLTEGESSGRYKLDTTPKVLADAIAAGTISISETADADGVFTINIKNYPRTSIKVKKEWDPSVTNEPNEITVQLLADGQVVKTQKLTSPNWTYTWTDLPKYKENTNAGEGEEKLSLIEYTVLEAAGTNNIYKVEYDFTDEVVETNCTNTGQSTITGWQDVGISNLNGKSFRIVSNGNVYYVENGVLKTGSATDTSLYNRNALWSTYMHERNSEGRYNVEFYNTASNGDRYYLCVGGDTYDTLAVYKNMVKKFEYSPTYKYMIWKNKSNQWRFFDGDLTGSNTSNNDKNTVTFQIPVYGTQQTCDETVTPASWTITNYYDTIDLDFEKTWDDAGHVANRPSSITVELLVNGVVNDAYTQTVTPDSNGKWTAKWTNLPKYVDGDEATYTAREVLSDDHYTSTMTVTSQQGKEIIGWQKVAYNNLVGKEFRIIANGKAYYLDSNNSLKSASKGTVSLYDRMLWKLGKAPVERTYGGHVYEIDMQFQSVFNPSYYIYNKPSANNNEAGDLLASTTPGTYTYYVNDQQIYYWVHNTYYGDWKYWFSGEIDADCAKDITFETPIYGGTGNDKITITNKYVEHGGLELIKVDENNASSNWETQAEFTIYHMRGEIAPVKMTLSDGKYLLESIPASLIPASGGDNYFFIVETKRPTQDGKEYAQLGTAIPISINTSGEVKLITAASQYPSKNFFRTGSNYNATTKMLVAAGTGANARPAIKVDFDQIGSGKAVSSSKDEKRIVITAKNTPINNELELIKIDNSTSEGKVDGATFSIKNESTGSYVSPAEGGLWTTSDGKWKVSNLAPGTYTIKEESAPKNYVKSNATVTVVVDEYTGEITVTPSDTNVVVGVTGSGTTSVSFKFINEISSYELPEAGGIGTTILYITGAILVIGAGVLLIVRKKMNK